ncbi:MAG: hypothetical protein M3Q29_15785 [Chloroflexota bacterium]|nr:hypothetical protein [Chloroflexota bacterium]
MSDLMKAKVDFPCPECGVNMHSTLDEVRRRSTVRCPRGHQVELVDKGGELGKVNRELDKLVAGAAG